MAELKFTLADVASDEVRAVLRGIRRELPDERLRLSLKVDDLAELLFIQDGRQELMWARVRGTWPRGIYAATLASGPNKIRGINQGYPLKFTAANVVRIYRGGRDSFAS